MNDFKMQRATYGSGGTMPSILLAFKTVLNRGGAALGILPLSAPWLGEARVFLAECQCL